MLVPRESSPAHSLTSLKVIASCFNVQLDVQCTPLGMYLIMCILTIECDMPVHISYQDIQRDIVLFIVTHHFLIANHTSMQICTSENLGLPSLQYHCMPSIWSRRHQKHTLEGEEFDHPQGCTPLEQACSLYAGNHKQSFMHSSSHTMSVSKEVEVSV